ncbi:MAG: DUF4342 domain-containing protein [Clostridiales Family XIII bacterium]|nr:DUF4342 domain-containing protein [Clostridiales Family XIII bacterium]
MEITLEKIELVKDRTGVSYKEAKEALEAADGNVVDAIISIEENINIGAKGKMGAQSSQVIDRLKELIKKGNVSKIVIKKDGEQVLNLPVNVGIVGTVLAPWAAVIGVIAAFGTKCVIEVVKDNGEVIDISEKAEETFGEVRERGAVIVDEVKERGAEVIDNVRSMARDIGKKPADEGGAEGGGAEPPSGDESGDYVSTSADESDGKGPAENYSGAAE